MKRPLVDNFCREVNVQCRKILGIRIDATSLEDATGRVLDWSIKVESRYVCAANVHMVMEAYDSRKFAEVVNGADLVTADGMPLVWALRMLGIRDAGRVYGPDLTLRILAAAARKGVPVGFYGGTPQVLNRLMAVVKERFPAIAVPFAWSPPFNPLAAEEDERVTEKINTSGARILFVGLGCPKQEEWMARHRGEVQGVMLGVGAAFDYIAGAKPQAPRWLMRIGFEWLFRMVTEPQRLWKRYLKHNPRFVLLLALQIIKQRCRRLGRSDREDW
jgi:N-acetylglucosaminyldiphosphoundecaprenol N-acetyl-beta-D-mannosaminyltransferase